MNCKESRILIAGLAGDETPEGLAAHVANCPACAERLAWDARLRATLRSQSPQPTAAVLDRIRTEIAFPRTLPLKGGQGGGKGLRGFLKGKVKMNLTLPVAGAAAALAVLASLPRPAEARSPLDVFNRMGQAVVAATGRLTPLEFRTMRRPDGTTAQIVSVGGRAIEPGPDGTVSFTSANGKTVNVRTQRAPRGDLSNFEPPQRQTAELIDRAAKRTGRPMTDFTVIDGKLADRAQSRAWERERGFESSSRVDLDPAHYRSIAFGADRNHLVLVPKAPVGGRYVVEVDPKSGLPRTVLLQRNERGRWVEAR